MVMQTKKTGNDTLVDHTAIIEFIKTCDEAELIEEKILDKRGMLNRVLLPLYIVSKHMENGFGLTSGDVGKITSDLGIKVGVPHASTTLSGKDGSKFVTGDKVRKKGVPVRYKLNRRGLKYMDEILGI